MMKVLRPLLFGLSLSPFAASAQVDYDAWRAANALEAIANNTRRNAAPGIYTAGGNNPPSGANGIYYNTQPSAPVDYAALAVAQAQAMLAVERDNRQRQIDLLTIENQRAELSARAARQAAERAKLEAYNNAVRRKFGNYVEAATRAYNEGDAVTARNLFSYAIDLYEKVIVADDPAAAPDGHIYTCRGLSQMWLGMFREAREDFYTAVGAEPDKMEGLDPLYLSRLSGTLCDLSAKYAGQAARLAVLPVFAQALLTLHTSPDRCSEVLPSLLQAERAGVTEAGESAAPCLERVRQEQRHWLEVRVRRECPAEMGDLMARYGDNPDNVAALDSCVDAFVMAAAGFPTYAARRLRASRLPLARLKAAHYEGLDDPSMLAPGHFGSVDLPAGASALATNYGLTQVARVELSPQATAVTLLWQVAPTVQKGWVSLSPATEIVCQGHRLRLTGVTGVPANGSRRTLEEGETQVVIRAEFPALPWEATQFDFVEPGGFEFRNVLVRSDRGGK